MGLINKSMCECTNTSHGKTIHFISFSTWLCHPLKHPGILCSQTHWKLILPANTAIPWSSSFANRLWEKSSWQSPPLTPPLPLRSEPQEGWLMLLEQDQILFFYSQHLAHISQHGGSLLWAEFLHSLNGCLQPPPLQSARSWCLWLPRSGQVKAWCTG